MIANNDEAKRSKIWTVVTAVTSVLIVIIAIFLLMKMFTGNSKEPQLYKMKEVKEVTNYAKNMPEKVAELQSILQSVREGKDLIGK